MDDKTNLYVFEKKEVALIFVFMILIAVTSFVLGVKVGKSFTYNEVEHALDKVDQIEILSEQEEDANDVMNQNSRSDADSDFEEDVHRRIEEHIKNEFENEGIDVESQVVPSETSDDLLQGQPLESQSVSGPSDEQSEALRGKYTIQLSSHRSKNEAEEFAQGFEVRGYEPIINEVEVPNKGIWYRVSIGVFDTITKAKEYVLQERSLFQGEDYVFQRL
jgi:cell division protein FtsN